VIGGHNQSYGGAVRFERQFFFARYQVSHVESESQLRVLLSCRYVRASKQLVGGKELAVLVCIRWEASIQALKKDKGGHGNLKWKLGGLNDVVDEIWQSCGVVSVARWDFKLAVEGINKEVGQCCSKKGGMEGRICRSLSSSVGVVDWDCMVC